MKLLFITFAWTAVAFAQYGEEQAPVEPPPDECPPGFERPPKGQRPGPAGPGIVKPPGQISPPGGGGLGVGGGLLGTTLAPNSPTEAPPNVAEAPPPPGQPPGPNLDIQASVGFAAPSNPAFDICIQSNPIQFCSQIVWWDQNAREQPAVILAPPAPAGAPPVGSDIGGGGSSGGGGGGGGSGGGAAGAPPLTAIVPESAVAAVPTDRSQCMSIQCICQFARGRYSNNRCVLPNGQVYGKAIRKELRMMSDIERNRFQNAMWTIRQVQYLSLARLHASYVSSPGAHFGPAFLPWHREFLKRLEIALRQVDPGVTIPYWDSTLDAALEDPTTSVLFSEELMGTTDRSGTVTTGMFAYWQAHLTHPTQRQLGQSRNSRLINRAALDAVRNDVNTIIQALAYGAAGDQCPRNLLPPRSAIEFIHGWNHIWIAGDMSLTTTATNDPIFWMHHCMIDNIWETWRLEKQSRSLRESDYPPDIIQCSSQSHFSRTVMVPFPPMINVDGLSNNYTDNLYQYDPRPTCSGGRDCGSRFLFCNRLTSTCVSRIRPGSRCNPSRYGGTDPCYGMCVSGICRDPLGAASGGGSGGGGAGGGGGAAGAPPSSEPLQPVEIDESCFNQNPCCATWTTRGLCNSDSARMNLICPASCKKCNPSTYTLQDDCSDRHHFCDIYEQNGDCESNMNFMAENCRKTCNLCGKPRGDGCS